jgi:diketogulonate reductase-like aldo/keto reductase
VIYRHTSLPNTHRTHESHDGDRFTCDVFYEGTVCVCNGNTIRIELHPWNQQKELTSYCEAESVAVMGYCPLARAKRFGESMLKDIAARLGKSEAQVAIRWSLQSGVITIPKSSKPSRITQNAEVFGWAIDDATMAEIASEVDEGFKASGSVNSQDLPWADVK